MAQHRFTITLFSILTLISTGIQPLTAQGPGSFGADTASGLAPTRAFAAIPTLEPWLDGPITVHAISRITRETVAVFETGEALLHDILFGGEVAQRDLAFINQVLDLVCRDQPLPPPVVVAANTRRSAAAEPAKFMPSRARGNAGTITLESRGLNQIVCIPRPEDNSNLRPGLFNDFNFIIRTLTAETLERSIDNYASRRQGWITKISRYPNTGASATRRRTDMSFIDSVDEFFASMRAAQQTIQLLLNNVQGNANARLAWAQFSQQEIPTIRILTQSDGVESVQVDESNTAQFSNRHARATTYVAEGAIRGNPVYIRLNPSPSPYFNIIFNRLQ